MAARLGSAVRNWTATVSVRPAAPSSVQTAVEASPVPVGSEKPDPSAKRPEGSAASRPSSSSATSQEPLRIAATSWSGPSPGSGNDA